MRLLLLNGPNLNLLGTRNPEVYGSTTLPELEAMFRGWADEQGIEVVESFQSNHEGALIDRIHAARGSIDGIVFNPGAFTHTSYALHDAIDAVDIATVEVHISNVEEREPWRRISLLRPACVHTVYGRGIDGYRWALLHLVNRAKVAVERIRYGDDPSQFADLRLPEDASAPLVVLVHGGFWRHQWTYDTTESIAVDLSARGFATLNVEYRRHGAGGDPEATVADVVASVAALRGMRDIDGRWAMVGHSAGAQLAVVAATRMEEVPRMVVTLGGVLDLEAAIEAGLGDGAAHQFLEAEVVDRFSPVALAPVAFPLVIAHGTGDDRVPFEHALRLQQAQRAAGGHESTLIPGPHGHFEYLDPRTRAWNEVAELLVRTLRPDDSE